MQTAATHAEQGTRRVRVSERGGLPPAKCHGSYGGLHHGCLPARACGPARRGGGAAAGGGGAVHFNLAQHQRWGGRAYRVREELNSKVPVVVRTRGGGIQARGGPS